MKIEKLSLKNFKQFEDISLDFATSQEKNITIIYGVMGAGKSSLFQAMNWCLYGSKIGNTEILPKEMLIANKRLLLKLENGEIGEVSVELTFSDNFKRYAAIRSAKYRKDKGSLDLISQDFYITLSNPSGEPELIKDYECQRIINMILPSTVREYFLFDGEKIDKFSRIGQEEEIKDSIHQVLGLTSLNIAKYFLENARKKYSEDRTGIEDQHIKEGIGLIEEFEEELKQHKKDQHDNKIELGLAEQEFSNIDEKLDNYEDRKGLLEERKTYEAKEVDLGYENNNLKEELREYINKSSLILGTKALDEASAIIQDFRTKKQIPSEYTETFLNDILNEGTCICGRKVENGSIEYQVLKKLIEDIPFSSALQNQIITLFGDINRAESTNKLIMSSMKKTISKMAELRGELDKNKSNLDGVKEKIGDFDEDEFNKLERDREEIKKKISSLKNKIAVLDDRIKRTTNEIENATKDLEKAKSKNKKDQDIKDKIIRINQTKKAIEALYTTYAEDKRKQIDISCRDIFQKLVWKTSQFKNVELNDKYELNVLDRFNTPSRPDLSAGERQLLSLAFITAMAKSAGKEAPFMLDTPFARISKEPRENIAKHLPEMISQLILLVTDVELTQESELIFNKRAGKTYTLMFDDSLGISHIEEGKHVK